MKEAKKCEFNKAEIKLFGFIFSKDRMKIDPEKVSDVVNASEPATISEMPSFLGMSNFSSHFIPNYSTVTGPLRAITRKHEQFEWTLERREAFQKIKQLMCKDETLAYLNPGKKTRLYMDGSKKDGVGSILAQYNEKVGKYQAVRYDSRALRDEERR